MERSQKKSGSGAILLAALAGAAAIIGIVVLLTPMDEIDEEAVTSSETTSSNAPVADFDYRPVSIAELGLPTQPAKIDAEQLREELKEVAAALQTEFPASPAAHHVAAQIFMELRQTKLAEAAWTTALQQTKDQLGPYIGLAEIQAADGQEAKAIELLNAALQRGLTSEELLQTLAECFENLGDLEPARDALLQALNQYPEAAKLWQALARVQLQLGDLADAESAARKSIAFDRADESKLFTLATALARQKKSEEAAQVRQQISALRQSQPKESPEFQDQYMRALKDIAYRLILTAASVARQEENLDRVEGWIRQAIALEPNGLRAYMSLAGLYLDRRQVGEALAVHELLLEKQPDNILNHVNLASLASKVGEMKLAESTLKDAVGVDPSGVLAQAALAKLYIAMQRGEEAILFAADVVQRSPSPEAYSLLAASYDLSNKPESAKAAIEKAKGLWPDHPFWNQASP